MLPIQESIAREIAARLRATLTPEEQTRIARLATENGEAYREYLKGRFFWNKRTSDGMQKAIEHFRRSLDHDPSFALAWVGLGDSFALLEQYAGIPSKDNCPRALSAIRRALEIDPNLPQAHASSGLLTAHCEWNWSRSEEHFLRAIELDPDYATTHHWYALHLAYRGEFDRAIGEANRAVELDPLSPIVNNAVSVTNDYARRHDETIEQSETILEMAPNFAVGHLLKSRGLRGAGRLPESLDEGTIVRRLTGDVYPESLSNVALTHAAMGNEVEALELVDDLMDSLAENPTASYQIAKIFAALDQPDRALEWLDRARESHSWHLVEIVVEPAFDSIREEPRFKQLAREIGLE